MVRKPWKAVVGSMEWLLDRKRPFTKRDLEGMRKKTETLGTWRYEGWSGCLVLYFVPGPYGTITHLSVPHTRHLELLLDNGDRTKVVGVRIWGFKQMVKKPYTLASEVSRPRP